MDVHHQGNKRLLVKTEQTILSIPWNKTPLVHPQVVRIVMRGVI